MVVTKRDVVESQSDDERHIGGGQQGGIGATDDLSESAGADDRRPPDAGHDGNRKTTRQAS